MSNNIYDLTRGQLAVLRWRYRRAAVVWVLTFPLWGTLALLAMASMWPTLALLRPQDSGIDFTPHELWTRIPTDANWHDVNGNN